MRTRRRSWLSLVALAACAPVLLMAGCGPTRQRAGDFEILRIRKEFGGHSSTRMSLVYRGRKLTRDLSDWTVDPRKASRIVYASGSPCGTYLFDGSTGRQALLRRMSMVVHWDPEEPGAGSGPWSPDGRFVLIGNDIGNPIAVDLRTREQIDLTDALSSATRRLSLYALAWSPGGRSVAAELSPQGFSGPDRDLIQIVISPLAAVYVATLTDPAGGGHSLWTTGDFHWDGERLASARSGRNGPILIRPAGALHWVPKAPAAPHLDLDHDPLCPPK